MGATDVEERTLADLRFGGGSPATWYVGLTKTVANDDGTNFTEPTTGAYARVAKTNNTTNYPAASTLTGVTTKANGTKITYPNPTADWGIIVGVGFFDVASGGTPRYVFELDTPITVRNGNTPVEFDVSQLVMVFD